MWFFQGFTGILNAMHELHTFCGRKNKNSSQLLCAGDFTEI